MMKNIKTTLRTLCLVALLCMSSANAMAYQILPGGASKINPENPNFGWGDNDILVVDGGQYNLESIFVYDFYKPLVLVITEGTEVSVSGDFFTDESFTIYVFGTLEVKSSNNEGTIYVMKGGCLSGVADGNIEYECSVDDMLTSRVVEGKKPRLNDNQIEHGWKGFYVKDAIIFNNDYYPIAGKTTYYTDATMETPIEDLEEWKKGEGKLNYSIDYYKNDAINAINEARNELVYIERYDKDVETFVVRIREVVADEKDVYAIRFAYEQIDDLKEQAFLYIQSWKNYVELIKDVIEARDVAIKEIYDAMKDILVYYPDCEKEVKGYIESIQGAERMFEVTDPKNEALAKIEKIREITNSAYKYYMGTFIKKQTGPAVKVKKGDETIILYGPDKVEFFNNTDKE